MAVRLHLKIGLVPAGDRLASSPDAVLHHEPSIGATSRSKGNLYGIVTVRPGSGGGVGGAAAPLAGRRGGAGVRSPIPLADPVAAAASAVGSRARDAREAVGGALAALVEGITGLLPRRRARYRRITPLASRRDSQRRAGVAALSFVGLVAALGIGLWGLAGAVPAKDEELGVAAATIHPLRTRVAGGLDRIYAVRQAATSVVLDLTTELSPDADIVDMVRGPDGAAYVVDRATASIFRVDLSSGDGSVVVTKGDGAGDGIGEPWLLALGGPDVFILDRDAALWRWRPSDAEGRGTLARPRRTTTSPPPPTSPASARFSSTGTPTYSAATCSPATRPAGPTTSSWRCRRTAMTCGPATTTA